MLICHLSNILFEFFNDEVCHGFYQSGDMFEDMFKLFLQQNKQKEESWDISPLETQEIVRRS